MIVWLITVEKVAKITFFAGGMQLNHVLSSLSITILMKNDSPTLYMHF